MRTALALSVELLAHGWLNISQFEDETCVPDALAFADSPTSASWAYDT